jgi:hypothetical protein
MKANMSEPLRDAVWHTLFYVFRHTCFHDLYFDLKMAIYRPKQLQSNKYITSYLVVLDGITYTLLNFFCYIITSI